MASRGARGIVLGDGTVTFQVPADWPEGRVGPWWCEFAAPWEGSRALRLEILSYRASSAADLEELGRRLNAREGVNRVLPEPPSVGGITFALSRGDEDRAGQLLARRVERLAPDLIRILEARLDLPPRRLSAAEIAKRMAGATTPLDTARFAAAPTALDRVAPDRERELLHLWDGVHLRVPRGWHTVPEDHGGARPAYCLEDPRDEDALSFWADFKQVMTAEEASAAMLAEAFEELRSELRQTFDSLQDRQLGEAFEERIGPRDVVLGCEMREFDSDDRQPLRRLGRHRVVLGAEGLLLGMFWLVRLESRIGEPRSDAAVAMAESEIRNAWITPLPRTE